jgi:sulfur transfer protein SufE
MSPSSCSLGTIPKSIPMVEVIIQKREKMKTIQEQETQAILAMGEKIKELQQQLNQANERVRQLESQVYGGPTK